MSDQFVKIPALARADACAIPMAGGGAVPFDLNPIIGYTSGMRIVARLLVLLPLLWVEALLCSAAHGAEVVEQITFLGSVSGDAVDARRGVNPDTLAARPDDSLILRLADSGPYEITIVKARRSSLGNTIIRGTTPSNGTSLLVIGTDGSVRGYFERPDEVVQVSSDEDGVVTAWVEGIDAEMIPIKDDVVLPPDETFEPSTDDLRRSITSKIEAISADEFSYARFKTGQATIRILIYYESTMNAIATVADYLVELTNIFFENSQVSAVLEIANLKPVVLVTSPLVHDILSAMAGNEAPFDSVDQDMSDYNADLAATLIGSGVPQGTAVGIAYRGGKFSAQRYSVSLYRGYQDGTALYYSTTFAHEIGHNLGANHNREQYENNGQDLASTFSYSFGYLTECAQRTVMSYGSDCLQGELGIPHYSNPFVSYDGYQTGISTASDNSAFVARALENNKHVAVKGSDNEFRFEEVRYQQGEFDSSTSGICRYVRLYNDTLHPINVASQTYVTPDGTETSYSANLTINAGETRWALSSCSSSAQHPFGTTYAETYFHYDHPITGVAVKSPVFPWQEIHTDHSELRIAYTDGGRPVGHTRKYLLPDATEDVIFESDRGFSIGEIKSTCEGMLIAGGFRVSATLDPCIVEASFSDDRTPPAKPIITHIQAGDGVASISVSVSDDGGADVTAISATCALGSNTYSGASANSPVSVGGMINGQTYECFARATNLKGAGAASDTISVTLPQTMPSKPTLTRADNGDGEVFLFVSDSGQPTTVDSYTATCTDGTNTFTGTSTSSPITVSGLSNGVAYTCTVTATNSVGTSSASAATDPITPEEASTGLPIWLLYQASQ